MGIRQDRAYGNTVSLSPEEVAMPEPERIDRRRAALIAYDICRRALAPSDPARKAAMRPLLDAWVQMIAANLDLASVVVRECWWSGDAAAHAYSLDKAMKMYARIRRLDQVAAMLRE